MRFIKKLLKITNKNRIEQFQNQLSFAQINAS